MDKNTLIFSAIVLILITYLIVELFIFSKRTLLIQKKREKAKLNLEHASAEKMHAKKILLEEIQKEFDEEVFQKISDGVIWQGMSELLLIASLGKALEIKEFKYNDTDAEKWFYNGYRNLLGTYSYKREVIVKNRVVIDYSDR